jgi:GNAT superfamily N-acetyltransferase
MDDDAITNENLRIDYLSEHEAFIPVVAEWLHEQWGFLDPEATVEDRILEFKRRFRPGGIPCAVIAMIDGNAVGTASLIEDDMPERPELTPWLASVYVAPEFRRQGIAEKMIGRIIDEAAAFGIGRLYLFTFNSSAYYSRRGWSMLCSDTYFNRPVTIMFKDLQ